ncbi:unnamed protein product [Auanema sp. JU1783]|nr:unnamed protein product [Auanema sp. JU1783]
MAVKKVVEKVVNPKLFPLFLYKRILRLHYGLPAPARLMGDSYVKDEFRRHQTASPEHTKVFLQEWTDYCVLLSKQMSTSGIVKGIVGKDMKPELLDKFADEQLRQLLELKIEAELDRQSRTETGEKDRQPNNR